MRRLLNVCLLLVLVGAVGYVGYRAKLLPFRGAAAPGSASPSPVAPEAARSSLRVSVAHRPEALFLGRLRSRLEAEGRTLEEVPFDARTSWITLAAGELDLLIAPLDEALIGLGRYDAGSLLFFSGSSTGYDLLVTRELERGLLPLVGVGQGEAGRLLTWRALPQARVAFPETPASLEAWLREGAVDGALLSSAERGLGLPPGTRETPLSSAESPRLTAVVLSRALQSETPQNSERLATLQAMLKAWSSYFPDREAAELWIFLTQDQPEQASNLARLEKEYRFSPPHEGRLELQRHLDEGLLERLMDDLIDFARAPNLKKPEDWSRWVHLPPALEAALMGGPPVPVVLPSPLSQPSPSPSPASSPSPQASVPPPASDFATNHFAGPAPADPWPTPQARFAVPSLRTQETPVLLEERIALATDQGLFLSDLQGKPLPHEAGNDPLLTSPLTGDGRLFVLSAKHLTALDLNGKKLWQQALSGTVEPTLTLTPQFVLASVRSGDGSTLLRFDRQSGEPLPSLPLPAPLASTPRYAAAQNSLMVCDQKNGLHRLTLEGAKVWSKTLTKPTSLPLAIDGQSVVVAEPKGRVELYSLDTGERAWFVELDTEIGASATLADLIVLVPSGDGHLYALRRETGEFAKPNRVALSNPLNHPAVVVDQTAYCVDDAGTVHVLSLPNLEPGSPIPVAGGPVYGLTFSPHSWLLLTAQQALLFSRS